MGRAKGPRYSSRRGAKRLAQETTRAPSWMKRTGADDDALPPLIRRPWFQPAPVALVLAAGFLISVVALTAESGSTIGRALRRVIPTTSREQTQPFTIVWHVDISQQPVRIVYELEAARMVSEGDPAVRVITAWGASTTDGFWAPTTFHRRVWIKAENPVRGAIEPAEAEALARAVAKALWQSPLSRPYQHPDLLLEPLDESGTLTVSFDDTRWMGWWQNLLSAGLAVGAVACASTTYARRRQPR